MPEFMMGVGRGAQKCNRKVNLVGALHDGRLIGYEAPVLDVDPGCPESSGVPPLHGLIQFAAGNALFCGIVGGVYCLPAGSNVGWPNGIRTLPCERAPGGHWLLGFGRWDKYRNRSLPASGPLDPNILWLDGRPCPRAGT